MASAAPLLLCLLTLKQALRQFETISVVGGKNARRPACVDFASMGSLHLIPDPRHAVRVLARALEILGRWVVGLGGTQGGK